MKIDVAQNKQKFIEIFKGEIHREGADRLLEWLEKSDFFTMPFTGAYTLSCEGGACLHALNSFRAMSEMVAKYRDRDPNFLLTDLSPDATEEEKAAAIADVDQSVAIISLLHDVCNANCWHLATKNVKNEQTQKWEAVPYYRYDDDFIYGHGSKSVFIITQFMQLYVEEAQAIRFHMQGKEIPYGTTIEELYYDVYRDNALAAVAGAAINEATLVSDKMAWDLIQSGR